MRQKVLIVGFVCFAIAASILATSFILLPATAQRAASVRYEYAVINGSYSPYPPEGAALVSSAANICYLQPTGCQNEEVRADLSIAKFLQDERFENNSRAKPLAQERAIQLAFSKAISKLGNDGWEIVSAQAIEFDLFYTNAQGVPSVKEANRTDRQHLWFKRPRQ